MKSDAAVMQCVTEEMRCATAGVQTQKNDASTHRLHQQRTRGSFESVQLGVELRMLTTACRTVYNNIL